MENAKQLVVFGGVIATDEHERRSPGVCGVSFCGLQECAGPAVWLTRRCEGTGGVLIVGVFVVGRRFWGCGVKNPLPAFCIHAARSFQPEIRTAMWRFRGVFLTTEGTEVVWVQ